MVIVHIIMPVNLELAQVRQGCENAQDLVGDRAIARPGARTEVRAVLEAGNSVFNWPVDSFGEISNL